MEAELIRKFMGLALVAVLAVTAFAANKSSYQLIEEAYRQGLVSDEEKLLLEVRSVKAPSTLPQQYQSATIETQKCATMILLEAQRQWDKLTPSGQQTLREIMARPTAAYAITSPQGYFRIHYNTTGTNAVPSADTSPANGIPDYVEWLASYADSSYRSEVINLGHYKPIQDGSLGGDSLYDIYTEEMGYYGYTQREGTGPNPWNDAYSYISVHRNFIGFPANDDPEGDQKGAAKVTVAHEYYHAIQFTYDYAEELWLMESSSTWMEDFVFDPVNDNFNYLSYWFSYPHYSLNANVDLHVYSAFIWPKYVSLNYGNDVMPDLWNRCISSGGYAVYTSLLASLGTSLNAEFAEFCVWNFITNSRDDGLHYPDALRYPLITTTRTHSSFPVSGQGPGSGTAPDAMASNYIVFLLPTGQGQFTVDFNGDNSVTWIVKFLAWKYGAEDTYEEHQLSLNASGDGSFTLTNPQDFNRGVLVICNLSQSLNDRSYTYGASFTPAPDYAVGVSAVGDDSVYSNSSSIVRFRIDNLGMEDESFALSASDEAGWNPEPTAPYVYITSGSHQTVSVSITCPPLTPAGVLDTVYLLATSVTFPAATDRDTATSVVFLQPGDADNSGAIDISDAVYLISYIFTGGVAPIPEMYTGDADCSGAVDISDAVFLITFIFGGGDAPPCKPF